MGRLKNKGFIPEWEMSELFYKKDIQLAIKWLKEQLMENNKRDYTDMCRLINKAFEDVCKDGQIKTNNRNKSG